jgi:hypothetical protein
MRSITDSPSPERFPYLLLVGNPLNPRAVGQLDCNVKHYRQMRNAPCGIISGIEVPGN